MSDRKIAITSLIVTIISLCATVFFGLRADGLFHFEKSEIIELASEETVSEETVSEELVSERSSSEGLVSNKTKLSKTIESISLLITFISGLLSLIFFSRSRLEELKEKKEVRRLQYTDKKYKKHHLTVNAHYEGRQRVILTVHNKKLKPIHEINMVVAINHLNEKGIELPYITSMECDHSLYLVRKAICNINLSTFRYQFDVIIAWYDDNKVKRSFCITLK